MAKDDRIEVGCDDPLVAERLRIAHEAQRAAEQFRFDGLRALHQEAQESAVGFLTDEEMRERFHALVERELGPEAADRMVPVHPDCRCTEEFFDPPESESEYWQQHGEDHTPNLLWRTVLAMSALYFLVRWVVTGERPTP